MGILSEKIIQKQVEEERKKCIESCKRGEKILPKTLNIGLTNMCNLHCIMCPYVSEETGTYFKEERKILSLENYIGMLGKTSIEEKDEKIEFDFMRGETLLNPECTEIFRYTKQVFPNSCIVVLSNGTIPPCNDEIIRYIDILGFSIDAATREVFEAIRIPSKYDQVIENIKKWMKTRKKNNAKTIFRTSTTLSTMNIFELPKIVELIHGLEDNDLNDRIWDSIYCQPVVIEANQDQLKSIELQNVNKEEGYKILKQTFNLAEEYHIRIDMPESVKIMFGYSKEDTSTGISEKHLKYSETCFCSKLSNGILSYDLDGQLEYPCCFMDKRYLHTILEDYNIPLRGSPIDIYNCEGYWKMREDLLNGKLNKVCRNCIYGKMDYAIIYEEIRNKVEASDFKNKIKWLIK